METTSINDSDSRLPSDIEVVRQSELKRFGRIKRQKCRVSKILILLLLDLSLCALLYALYKHYSASTNHPDNHPVFFWILILSLFRCALVIIGTTVAVAVGSPTSKAIARELGQIERRRHQRTDIIDEMTLFGNRAGNDTNRLLSVVARRKRHSGHDRRSSTGKLGECQDQNITVPTTASETPGDLATPLLDSSENQSPLKKLLSPKLESSKCNATYSPPVTTSRLAEISHNSGCSSGLDSVQCRNGPCNNDEQMLETLGLFGTDEVQKLEDETRYHRAVKRVESIAHVKRNFILVAIFLGLTLSNFICCVWFIQSSSDLSEIFRTKTFLFLPLHGWIVTCIIVIASTEFFSVQQLIFKVTSDSGILIRSIHPHKMYFDTNMDAHSCDNCHRRFRGQAKYEGYRCRICDFDLCLRCFKLRSLDRGEGVLRSDKGPKRMVEYSTWMYLKRALKLSFPFIHWLIFSFVLLVATQVVGLVLPTYQGKVIDDVYKQNTLAFKSDIIIYAIGSLVTSVLSSISSICVSIVQKNLEAGLRVKLFQSVLGQDVAFFDGMMTGQISSRIQSDVQQLISPCYTILNTGLSNAILLIGALYMCLNTSWQLTVLVLCSIGPIVTITNNYARWARPIWSQVWQALGDSNSIALQTIMNIRSVRSFATEEKELKKYQGALTLMLRKSLLNSFASSLSSFLAGCTELCIGVLILAIGGSMVIAGNGTLTVGKLIAFELYWNKMDSAYNSLNGILNTLIQTSAAAERVFSVMECKADIEVIPKIKESDSWGREVQPTNEPLTSISHKAVPVDVAWNLQIREVRFTYQMRPETEVLKGVDLEIQPGSIVAFVGRSGGGKSTLIHLLQRFYDPTLGSILYGGIDLREIDLKWYRSQIGVVQQETHLFNISIKENISYGAPFPVTLAAVVDAAKKSCLHDFIITLEEGYDTRVGERGTRLSGGQKQRIAIARALLRRPRLLLLDEATSALDAQSEAQVQTALDNLMLEMQGRCTIILVAHRLSTVINADQIFVVDNGTIAERGTHQELLDKNSIYASLVHQQINQKKNEIPES